jgi:hypothetical protein
MELHPRGQLDISATQRNRSVRRSSILGKIEQNHRGLSHLLQVDRLSWRATIRR